MNVWNGLTHTGNDRTRPEQLNASTQEQKKLRLKQFLKVLSDDPSLLKEKGCPEKLSEMIGRLGVSSASEPVDMARIVTASLNQAGIQACHEDMQNYVLSGGTIDEFISERGRMAP